MGTWGLRVLENRGVEYRISNTKCRMMNGSWGLETQGHGEFEIFTGGELKTIYLQLQIGDQDLLRIVRKGCKVCPLCGVYLYPCKADKLSLLDNPL